VLFLLLLALPTWAAHRVPRTLHQVLHGEFAKHYEIKEHHRKKLENGTFIVNCRSKKMEGESELLILLDSNSLLLQADLLVSRQWMVQYNKPARDYIRDYLLEFSDDSVKQHLALLFTKLWRPDRAELSGNLDAAYQVIMGRAPAASFDYQDYHLIFSNGKPEHTVREQLSISVGVPHADPRWEFQATPTTAFLGDEWLLKNFGLDPFELKEDLRIWRNKSSEATMKRVLQVCKTFTSSKQAKNYHRAKLHENSENAAFIQEKRKVGKELKGYYKCATNDSTMHHLNIQEKYYYFMFYYQKTAVKIFMITDKTLEYEQVFKVVQQSVKNIKEL
jgi:hypothetical protein